MSEVNPKPEQWIDAVLARRRADGQERRLTEQAGLGGIFHAHGRRWLNLASNDYLDLARHPALAQAAGRAVNTYGCGSGASRLVTGTLPLHTELETLVAAHKGYPAALTFGCGYLTNAGVVPALVGRHDQVFADRLAHASLLDAVQLSGARLQRFAHNQPADLARRLAAAGGGRRLIVTESLFSMDGDLAPLEAIADLARRYDAMLLVDEAHAGGVYGPHGAGLVHAARLQSAVTVCMGTFSKALGGYGGYAACSQRVRDLLVNTARALIYTTAPPPATVAAAIAALKLLNEQPGLGEQLLAQAHRLRDRLQAAGLDTLHAASQIIPVLLGSNDRVLRVAERLREHGILVGAIRPPTVPQGTARLRLSVTLAHSEEDLDRVAAAVLDAVQREPA